MKRITILTLALMCIGATSVQAKSLVSERVMYWQQKVTRDLPRGTSRAVVLKWVAKNHFEATENPKTHGLTINLESLSLPPTTSEASNSTVTECLEYQIKAILSFDAS